MLLFVLGPGWIPVYKNSYELNLYIARHYTQDGFSCNLYAVSVTPAKAKAAASMQLQMKYM